MSMRRLTHWISTVRFKSPWKYVILELSPAVTHIYLIIIRFSFALKNISHWFNEILERITVALISNMVAEGVWRTSTDIVDIMIIVSRATRKLFQQYKYPIHEFSSIQSYKLYHTRKVQEKTRRLKIIFFWQHFTTSLDMNICTILSGYSLK